MNSKTITLTEDEYKATLEAARLHRTHCANRADNWLQYGNKSVAEGFDKRAKALERVISAIEQTKVAA